MRFHKQWLAATLLITNLALGACATASNAPDAEEAGQPPAVHTEENGKSRLTLTEDAVQRIDIQTVSVRDGEGANQIIPYAAILYDAEGHTWAYTNPENLVFVREPIVVDHIQGDEAFLSEGLLPAGSSVVTIGAAELYGAESEFEEE